MVPECLVTQSLSKVPPLCIFIFVWFLAATAAQEGHLSLCMFVSHVFISHTTFLFFDLRIVMMHKELKMIKRGPNGT